MILTCNVLNVCSRFIGRIACLGRTHDSTLRISVFARYWTIYRRREGRSCYTALTMRVGSWQQQQRHPRRTMATTTMKRELASPGHSQAGRQGMNEW